MSRDMSPEFKKNFDHLLRCLNRAFTKEDAENCIKAFQAIIDSKPTVDIIKKQFIPPPETSVFFPYDNS